MCKRKPKKILIMDALKKHLPLFLTIVGAIVVAGLVNEQVAKMRVGSMKSA
jgi:hypothetical protein